MAYALEINPRRKRRRRRTRRRRTYRRRSYRRRRNPTLRVMNPRRGMGNLMPMITDAAQMSIGAVLAKALPARFAPTFVTDPQKKALAAIGTGLVISMAGGRFLGRKMATNLALGATMVGVSSFIEKFLPAGMKGMGDTFDQLPLTAAEVDDELQRVLTSDVAGLGYGEEEDIGTVSPEMAF